MKKIFPSVKIFGFPSVKTPTLPWKYPKNCPWKNQLHTWKFPANRIRENGTAVREKYDQIKISFYWKIALKYQILPVKRRNLIRENPRKLLISYPWKNKSIREKFLKSVRENFGLPVKSWKKVCVKASSLSVKKPEKRAQNGFHGHFWFSWEKKTLHWIYHESPFGE